MGAPQECDAPSYLSRLIVPIPGTTNVEHLKENPGAVKVVLSPDEGAQIDSAYSMIKVQARTSPQVAALRR